MDDMTAPLKLSKAPWWLAAVLVINLDMLQVSTPHQCITRNEEKTSVFTSHVYYLTSILLDGLDIKGVTGDKASDSTFGQNMMFF